MRLTVAFAMLVVSVPAQAQQCLTYRHRVTISGLLTRQTFPGPPNFESIAKGDARDVSLVLTPTHSLCVDALTKDRDEIDVAIGDVRSLQLVTDKKSSRMLQPLVGKSVTVSGSLFGAVTGWHHTPVLLSDVQLKP